MAMPTLCLIPLKTGGNFSPLRPYADKVQHFVGSFQGAFAFKSE